MVHLCCSMSVLSFPMVQTVKNLPAVQETWVQSLDQEDPLEREMATHSSILAWRIPWTEQPGRLQSVGSQESDTTELLTLSLSLHYLNNYNFITNFELSAYLLILTFSKLFWLLQILCICIQILKSTCKFLSRKLLKFLLILH